MLDLTRSLDAAAPAPLYQQLYDSLSAQIRAGRLRAGDRLPGKRSLANQLAVAVNTVDTAYQMLAAEGYLESRPRSGFFVLPCAHLPVSTPADPGPPPAAPRRGAPRFSVECGRS